MAGFRYIQMYFLLLQITESVAGQRDLYVTVRDGDEATLPCDSVMYGSKNCDSTTWLFDAPGSREAVVGLVRDGQIDEAAKDKSDRLSVSENCSLVIKNVKDEDVGRYYCRQIISGQQQGSDAPVFLSVVTMTEDEDDDEVTLRCSVSAYRGCGHTVKWLLQGQDVEEDDRDFRTSQSFCSASLTFLTSHFIYTSRFKSFQCNVTRGVKVQQFSFRNSPSGDETGDDTIPTTPWLSVGVALGLAALLIVVVVVVVRCIKTRANQTRVDDNIVLTSNPAQSAPADRQHPADPEGVSYASISHPGNNNKTRVRGGENSVTYSAVNLPSADDNNLYATINQ